MAHEGLVDASGLLHVQDVRLENWTSPQPWTSVMDVRKVWKHLEVPV